MDDALIENKQGWGLPKEKISSLGQFPTRFFLAVGILLAVAPKKIRISPIETKRTG